MLVALLGHKFTPGAILQDQENRCLHTHFTEMISALASAISNLSAQTPSIQVPTEADDLPVFYRALFTELFKGSKENKNYQSSKCWSQEVVSLLTCLHFDYLKNGTCKVQTVQTLIELGAESKRKFDQDQQNKEDDIKEKRKKIEDQEKLVCFLFCHFFFRYSYNHNSSFYK